MAALQVAYILKKGQIKTLQLCHPLKHVCGYSAVFKVQA